MSITLTRDSFLSTYNTTDDIQQVELPDGNHIFIKPLTGRGADAFAHATQNTPDLARSTLLAQCVCDKDGAPFFTNTDVFRVAELPNTIVLPIVDAIIEHNGLNDDGGQAALGFSEATPSSVSGSDSPATPAAV